MAASSLAQFARQAIPRLERLILAEEIPVPEAARLLGKKTEWVREHFPIIKVSRKSHFVRMTDVEAFQARRTVWPKWLKKNGEVTA